MWEVKINKGGSRALSAGACGHAVDGKVSNMAALQQQQTFI